jgi:hypothetical protein
VNREAIALLLKTAEHSIFVLSAIAAGFVGGRVILWVLF